MHRQPSSQLLLPLALSTMGSWLAESNMASPAVISKYYLDEAVAKTDASGSKNGAINGAKDVNAKSVEKTSLRQLHVTVARFADGQYQTIKDHMDSSLYAEKMRVLKEQVGDYVKVACLQS